MRFRVKTHWIRLVRLVSRILWKQSGTHRLTVCCCCFFFKPVTTNTWALHQQPLTSYRPELNQEKPVLILSERGPTVGLSDHFQQNNSFRKASLKTVHFYCLTYMHFRILKSHLKKERKNNVYQFLLFNVAIKDVSLLLISKKDTGVVGWDGTKGRKKPRPG